MIPESIIPEEDAGSNFAMPGAPKKKTIVPPKPELPPKIRELNDALRSFGRGVECLEADASEGQIARAEKLVLIERARWAVPFTGGDPSEHRKKEREYYVHVYGQSDSAPGFLKRLFSRAERAKHDAALAQAQADAEVAAFAARQERHATLTNELERAVSDQKLAQQRRESMEEALAELDSPDAIVRRWLAANAGQDPGDVAKYINWDRNVLSAVIEEWPVVEDILSKRIAKIKKQIEAIENEP
jgi:hypothetical protein